MQVTGHRTLRGKQPLINVKANKGCRLGSRGETRTLNPVISPKWSMKGLLFDLGYLVLMSLTFYYWYWCIIDFANSREAYDPGDYTAVRYDGL